MSQSDQAAATPTSSTPEWKLALRLLIPSVLGIFIFFAPITIGDTRTIPLDHMVNGLRDLLGDAAAWVALAMIIAGAVYPFVTGQWKGSLTDRVFTVLKILGVVAAAMAISGWGPDMLQAPGMLPFLFDTLVISVGLIVPIGAVFLALLISFGLLQLVGVLFQPLMKPVWKTPGRSAIDAVASFVGSYSIGLLITNRVYSSGQYSAKEAAIIATGFSTVSATFMIIVARTLDLMHIWNLYFWLTLLITFLVTAITVRLPPLRGMDNTSERPDDTVPKGQRLSAAWRAGLQGAAESPGLVSSVRLNVKEGLIMAISILPSIMSVGLIGLVVANHTPIFDWLGWVFWPFAAIWGLPEALDLSRAAAAGLAEMFLPALLMTEADLAARFAAGVVSVSSVLFFSASIPCILATRIPLSVPQIVAVWFIRVALSLFIAVPVAYGVVWLAG